MNRISAYVILAFCALTFVTWAQEDDPSPTSKPVVEQRKANRLANEKSPYLRQHRFNPVAWWPWCEEAFVEAKRRGVPVFLSIGYSTCHWCHVMEHESFENEEIAAYMNENFVCIKLDREERPDIDAVYMRVVQLLSKRSGWPASLFLTDEKKAFFGGTYFPPQPFHQLLKNVTKAWNGSRAGLLDDATNILQHISSFEEKKAAKDLPSVDLLSKVLAFEKEKHDSVDGGFGGAPKFPRTSVYEVLMRSDDEAALKVSTFSLRKMANGGIYDHVGGGFHRYATDKKWLIPHFEKMLYDQALIAETYLEAAIKSGDSFFLEVARDTLDCIMGDFSANDDGLYSAYDADSGGVEGGYYVWTKAELSDLLLGKGHGATPNIQAGAEESERPSNKGWDVLNARFDIKADGNWINEKSQKVTILAVRQDWNTVAKSMGITVDEAKSIWTQVRWAMRDYRSKRLAPGLDNKILTGWTGLGISALARGGRILGEDRFTLRAVAAAKFILGNLKTKEGRLLRRWCDGEAAFTATLQDYAYFGLSLIDVFEATGDIHWIQEAVAIADVMMKDFTSPNGALYDAPASKDLVVRLQDAYDGARPSSNSKACMMLLKLHDLTGRKEFLVAADGILKVFKDAMDRTPWYYPSMMKCVLARGRGFREIVIIGSQEARAKMEAEVNKTWLPDAVLCFMSEAQAKKASKLIPLVAKKTAQKDGAAVAYVCRNGTCKLPAKTVKELTSRLSEK